MMSTWRVERLNKSLGDWAQEWDALNSRLNAGHPLLDSRFVGPLLKHFGRGDEYLCIHRSEAGIDGMCILCPGKLGYWTTFCPAQAQIAPVLLRDRTILLSLFQHLPGLAVALDLLNIDPDFQGISAPEELHELSARALDHAVTINVNLEDDFDGYWAGRSKKLRSNQSRYLRRLSVDAIEPVFLPITESIKMRGAVYRFGELESSGWKGREGTAVKINNQQGAFFLDVMMGFAETQQAAVYEYRLGDSLAASRLNISGPEMTVCLKTAYDEDFSSFAPGQLLLNQLIHHEFDLGERKTIEFYTNASRDQLAWATGHRVIRHFTLYRNSLVAGSIDCAGVLKRSILDSRFFSQGKAGSEEQMMATIRQFSGPAELSAEYSKPFELAEIASLDQGLVWYQNLVETVFPDNGVRFISAEVAGSPFVVMPIRVEQTGAPSTREVVSLSNYYTWLYAPVVSELATDRVFSEMVAYMAHEFAPLSIMRFMPMDPRAASFGALERGMRQAGWLPFRFFCFGNWYLNVAGQSWDAYLATRSSQLRSTIKRKGKKFQADGGTLAIVSAGDAQEDALAAYQEIYAASWKNVEPFPAFIPGLVRLAASKGWLRLGVARINGTPIAAQIWLVAHGTANIYKLAYNENYVAYSAGTLLTAHLLQHVMDVDHVTTVDFLSGDDAYKTTWMSARRERWGIVAYNPRTLGGLAGLMREVAGRGVKKLLARLKNRREPS